MIVGAAAFILDENRPSFYDLYTTNDGVTPTLGYAIKCLTCNFQADFTNFFLLFFLIQSSPLEDYTLCMVDIRSGQVTDQINLKNDKIFLSHNQGLYLYKNTLAVLSVQHQTIYLYDIFEGHFLNTMKIGRFCNEEEIGLYNIVNPGQPAMREATFGSLKHRLLTFLFRQAKDEVERTGNGYALRRFYQFFDQYKLLRMWKIQLLDENMLLIKYASESVVTLKAQEPNSHPAFFVIYNIWESKVLAVYENTSEEFL